MVSPDSDYDSNSHIVYFESPDRSSSPSMTGSEEDAWEDLTHLFTQQVQPPIFTLPPSSSSSLAGAPHKVTKYTAPVILTAQEASSEAATVRAAFEQYKVSPQERGKIFEIENAMRNILLSEFPEKGELQHLYDHEVVPELAKAKESLVNHPAHLAAKAAAVRGKAAQAGFRSLEHLIEQRRIVEGSGVSAQEVFLLPEEGVVFKRASAQAKEEEFLASELFSLMSEEAVVGTFEIKRAAPERFGIPVSAKIQSRGYTAGEFHELSSKVQSHITGRLSTGSIRMLEAEAVPIGSHIQGKSDYNDMKDQMLEIQLPGEERQQISFKQLQRRYQEEGLPPETMIFTPLGSSSSFGDIVEGSVFYDALHYIPKESHTLRQLTVCPNPKTEEERTAFEKCEKCRWSYEDDEGNKVEATFKEILIRILDLGYLHNLTPIVPSGSPPPTKEDVDMACDVNWKVFAPEVMEQHEGEVRPLTDIQAKPFIAEMLLMNNLTPQLEQAILSRLTPDAQFNAIMTAELQMLDLHSWNLGVEPEPNEAYERYKDVKFITPPGSAPISLLQLLERHLSGQIPPGEVIEFMEEGVLVQRPLEDLPDLRVALEVKWKFVIFDTDLCLSESNVYMYQTRDGASEAEYLIPVRSVLLETEWKDSPLPDEVVERLMHSDERDRRVERFVKKDDAPIYKRLSSAVREDVKARIAPYVEQWTLGASRESGMKTVKEMRKGFIDQVSNVDDPALSVMWTAIEDDLSQVRVRQNDNWESIARRHKQSVEDLLELNPGGLPSEGLVRIRYDLTSDDVQAQGRREEMAAQLFPRLTHLQQQALSQRQHARNAYLTSFQALAQSTLTGEELMTQINDFLHLPSTPMKTSSKAYYIKLISDNYGDLLANPEGLTSLKDTICRMCRPSYFNLMKAMYPVLADAYEYYETYWGDSRSAGISIGTYKHPLNPLLDYFSKFPDGSYELWMTRNILEKIAAEVNPGYFGHRGTPKSVKEEV